MKEFKLKINGNDYNVTINSIEDLLVEVEVNGMPYHVEIEKVIKQKTIKTIRPAPAPTPTPTPVSDTGAPVVLKPEVSTQAGSVLSPLPGVILEILVKEGDTIKKGQKLMVLEAMKMENSIESDRDGKVVAIKVSKGASVLEGAELVIIG